MPFEAIDKTIYKSSGNCVCFITSEKRIHAWMRSIAQRLYFDLRSTNKYNVIWRDHKDKSAIIHTEFIVSDSLIDTEDTGDDFLYKVIVYLTTGKVLIQGKCHEEFCDNEFPKCLGLVNEYINIPNTANNDIVHSDDNSDQTLVKSTFDSVQSDGPDLAQSGISDETLIKCLDDDHELDPETSDQTVSIKTNTHKPVHVDNQAESYINTSECTKATSKQDFIESNKTDQAKGSDHSLKTDQVEVTQQIDSALIDPLVP